MYETPVNGDTVKAVLIVRIVRIFSNRTIFVRQYDQSFNIALTHKGMAYTKSTLHVSEHTLSISSQWEDT